MHQIASEPIAGVPTDNLDGSTTEMYPVCTNGTLIAFAWRPDAIAAFDLYTADPASYRYH